MQTVCIRADEKTAICVCECKTPLTVNSVDLVMGDPHKDIFRTTIVVGVTISIFTRRSLWVYYSLS